MPGIDHLIRTDFKTVDKRDEMRNVLSYLTGDTDTRPIITDHERPVGIVNDKAMMRRRLDPNMKLEPYLSTTRAVTPETDVAEVVRRLIENRASYIPVEDKRGKTQGYVSALDIAKDLHLSRDAGAAAVRVTPLREDQTLGDALHMFNQEYIDVLPVVDAQGKVTGVLKRSVIVSLGAATGRSKGRKDANPNPVDLLEMPISGHLATDFETLPVDADGEQVLTSLEKFGHAVILDRTGSFFGIVTDETILQGTSPTAEGELLPEPPGLKEQNKVYQYRRQS